MKFMRDELNYHRMKHGIIKKEYCTEAETQTILDTIKNGRSIESDIYKDENNFKYFRYSNTDLNEQEIKELLQYKQVRYTKTIKNCVAFITTLIVLWLIIRVIYMIMISIN